MTEATLIYNPNAGWLDLVTAAQLEEGLRAIGYDVEYRPTECEEDLDVALESPGEVVVVAGGDGTVRATALRLLDREVSIAIVPMGTANNIARTLGIDIPPLDLVAGLDTPRSAEFDVGDVKGPWGEDIFLEVFGLGLIAHTVSGYASGEERSLGNAFLALAAAVVDYHRHALLMTFDGHDLSGEYAMVTLFNTPFLGPRLELMQQAEPGDGLLDLMCIRGEDRGRLLSSLTAVLSGDPLREELSGEVEIRRGSRLEILWDGYPVHVDAEARPPNMHWPNAVGEDAILSSRERGTISAGVRPGALRLLLPRLDRSAKAVY